MHKLQNRNSSVASPVIDHVVTESGLLALEVEWRSLESQMIQLPFVSFDWLIPWWRHLSSHRKLVRDELLVCTFRSQTGVLLGIAPLMLTHRPSAGPLRFRQLQFFGADPNITEVRCIAAAPENMSLLYSALVEHLGQLPKQWNSTTLTGLPGDDAQLEESVNGAFAANYWDQDTVNPILVLKPTWEEFKAELPRNIKESLRKCYNAPKRDGIPLVFNVVTEPAEVDSALRAFFELHRARSKMLHTVSHRDYFSSVRCQRFLIEVCERFARRGALRIFQIKNQDSIVATRIGFVLGDALYLYYSGYDPAYQKFSVMTTVLAEAIQSAISNGLRTVNLSTGRDVSKTRWSPIEVKYRNVEFSSQKRLDILKHQSYRMIKSCLRQRSTDTWISRAFSRDAS
jgi:CelD/BcsL family acetyltransferase involved in cellulose biosynthesis